MVDEANVCKDDSKTLDAAFAAETRTKSGEETMKRQLVRLLSLIAILAFLVGGNAAARERWTVEQVNAWYAEQPWLVGCNFTPSTAINQLEMWQADTFDPETIDRELGWAADIGFNSIRVYLHNLLWEQDNEAFLRRVDQFLAIADKHGIGVMFVPLDGVWDPQPKLGKQREPRPHVHNSGWLQAPGAEILDDPRRHDELRPYIYGLIRHFRDDSRVQLWDVFNEPDNPNRNSYGRDGTRTELPEDKKEQMATRLLKRVFVWAREANPSQPLTAGVWRGDLSNHDKLTEYNRVMLEESDIVSFHSYGDLPSAVRRVDNLRRYNRPMICTEYMSRGSGSTFDPVMGYLKEHKIGAYNWGLVAGKTQTHYPWETWRKQYTAEPELWFHEIFRKDGTPYDAAETKYIRSLTKEKATAESASKAAAEWLAGLGEKGLVLSECDGKHKFVGRKIAGSQSVMFVFEKPGWYVTLGFSGAISVTTDLKTVRARLKYVALDRLPTPGLEARGWEIKPRTPVSSFKKGVEIVEYRDGVIKLRIRTNFFALYGRDPSVLVPADASMPKSAYFQIRQAFPLDLTLEAPISMGKESK